jgi:hypothetical protein
MEYLGMRKICLLRSGLVIRDNARGPLSLHCARRNNLVPGCRVQGSGSRVQGAGSSPRASWPRGAWLWFIAKRSRSTIWGHERCWPRRLGFLLSGQGLKGEGQWV